MSGTFGHRRFVIGRDAFTATQLTELMTVAIGVKSFSGSMVARLVRNLVQTRSLPTAYIKV